MKLSITNVAWFAGYVLMLIGIWLGLSRYRASAIETYGTSQASEDWQAWKSAAEQLAEEGPVKRRPPKATEPPALMLMRDHFPACLGISLLLSSCLFAWFMVSVRGAFRPVVLHGDEPPGS